MEPIIKSKDYDLLKKKYPTMEVECDICGEWVRMTFADYDSYFDCSELIPKQLRYIKCDNCKKCVC